MNLMALTLVGLALMPRLLTMKPSSFPDGTPNTLDRVELLFEFPKIFKCLGEVCNELVITFCLDDDIIDIGLDVAPDLPLEASLNGLL